ncbi:hypothetical protein ACQKJZ_14430, partial [Sphingomonas sp. NPDC019816]|uniref:hypothetical protein n=1 Tax=Sphingomonas sp. NPDC019816 TaxID=3390679 RepID=UPI003D02CBC6
SSSNSFVKRRCFVIEFAFHLKGTLHFSGASPDTLCQTFEPPRIELEQTAALAGPDGLLSLAILKLLSPVGQALFVLRQGRALLF